MTNTEKAHKLIDFLEKSNYTGEIRIAIEEHTFKLIGNTVPPTKPTPKPVAKKVVSKNKPVTIKDTRSTPVEKIQWARGAQWTAKVVKQLRDKGIDTVEILEGNTIDELKNDTKFSDGFIRMVREGLGTVDKNLLGASVVKRT